MPKLSLRQQADALLQQYGPEIAAAYQKSIDEVRSQIVLAVVVDRLKAGDIDGVIAAMHLERAAFAPLELAIQAAYNAGGGATAASFPSIPGAAGRIVIRWDMRNPVAEAWLRNRSSDLVTGIIADQKVAIQTTLHAGLAAGQNPTDTALDVVGRLSRATGKREGGIIGLTSQQAGYVATAKDELASGDAAMLKNYLTRGRRDKRYDQAVAKAIETGKPVAKDTADAAATSYSNRLLKLRGDTIGKNETSTAMSASKHETYRQAAEAGKINAADVKRTWRHFASPNPRHWHEDMEGVTIGLGQVYILPDGAVMRHPHDPAAGAKETIGCLCQEDYKVDYFGRTRMQ